MAMLMYVLSTYLVAPDACHWAMNSQQSWHLAEALFPVLQDLSIDMQALAASLSYLPIHSVLNIEACYCTDFAKPLSQAATGLQRHGNDCAAVSTSATEVDHGKPSQLHKHDVSHEPPVDLVRNPAGDVEENAAGTSQLGLISDRNSLDMAGHNEASRETAADNMMQRDAGSASQMSAAVVQRQPCTKAAEPSESSKAGLSSDDDELDAILDPGTHSAAKSRSTVVQQTSKQEQGSLEDWLDSL